MSASVSSALVSSWLSLSLFTAPTTNTSCFAMNISGTLNVFRLLRDPSLCLPQHTISTFNHLPIPISKAFPRRITKDGEKEVEIQAVILDKDNCFAVPHTNEIHEPYHVNNPAIFSPIVHLNSLTLILTGSFPASAASLSWLQITHSIKHGWYKLRQESARGSIT